jgi:hypothetical protein
MKILQGKDFRQFEIEKSAPDGRQVSAFMRWELKNLAFKFDSKENFSLLNS